MQNSTAARRRSFGFFVILLGIGAAILIFAFFRAKAAAIAGWEPVNTEMQQTIEHYRSGSLNMQDDTDRHDRQAEVPMGASEQVKSPPAETKPSETKLSINTANQAELMTLPGIGESKARAIIAYREANGPFTSIEHVQQVKGIGPKMYDKLKGLIRL